jgi:hypothetical protein
MRTRRVLAVVSAAQLAAGVAGQRVALRDGRSFDIAVLGWRGRPERVARDSWFLGTGLSAPVVMLATQAIATARLAVGPSQAAMRTLGVLGAVMTCGYLVEREFRVAASPGGWNPVVTPIAAAGSSLALVMGFFGLRGERSSEAEAGERSRSQRGKSGDVSVQHRRAVTDSTRPSRSRISFVRVA